MPILPQFLARPLVGGLQAFFAHFGFELWDPRPPHRDIKDAGYYRPLFQPWLMEEWRARLRADDPRSLVPPAGKYVLYCNALDATRRCDGEVVECGVYKGGTAKLLAEIAPDRPLSLFDTFAGMPKTDIKKDLHKRGDFADTSVESVRQYLAGHPNAQCFPGLIPDSLDVIKDKQFAFVHIDLDIYSAIMSACEFFYPRMQPGGLMLFDDYGYASCPGARAAIEEFFADKPEVLMAEETGQCIVRKL